jgi:hypothetical protein
MITYADEYCDSAERAEYTGDMQPLVIPYVAE